MTVKRIKKQYRLLYVGMVRKEAFFARTQEKHMILPSAQTYDILDKNKTRGNRSDNMPESSLSLSVLAVVCLTQSVWHLLWCWHWNQSNCFVCNMLLGYRVHLQLFHVLMAISVCTCSSSIKTICRKEINNNMRFNITCTCNDNIKVWEIVLLH